MAENWVTITADISKVNDYESCKNFLLNLHQGDGKSDTAKNELEKFLKDQSCDFGVDDFTQYEYLSCLQDLTIKEDKKTFKAEFNTGSGVVDFCNEFNNLFKEINAKRLKIKAIDDNEFEEIDWKTLGKSIDELLKVEPYKKPKSPIKGKPTGEFSLVSPDGVCFAKLSMKNGHLNGKQTIIDNNTGKAMCIVEYKSGIPHGSLVAFNRDRSIAIEANYSKGLLEGSACGWDSTGFARIKSNFKNGEPHGHQIVQMSADDEPFLEATYINGVPDGIFHWKKSETEIFDIEFKDGEPIGEIEEHILIDIGIVEEVLIPHKKLLMFVDPQQFYSLIPNLLLEPIEKGDA